MSAARRLLIPVAVTLCGLAVLLGLGTWQLERKGWKEGLIATLNERTAAAPVALPPPEQWGRLTADNSEFMRVRLRADFRSDDALVYTSGSALRDDVKSPGYFVFAAGRLPGGQHVIVNRGYVKERGYPRTNRAGGDRRLSALAGGLIVVRPQSRCQGRRLVRAGPPRHRACARLGQPGPFLY